MLVSLVACRLAQSSCWALPTISQCTLVIGDFYHPDNTALCKVLLRYTLNISAPQMGHLKTVVILAGGFLLFDEKDAC